MTLISTSLVCKIQNWKGEQTQMAAAVDTMENKAKIAAIAAAFLQGHSHIATDSLSSLKALHQIRKQTLYPELHRQHVQGQIIKMIIQLVRNSPTPIYLYKVNLTLELQATNAQMPLPNTRLFR
eukprot:352942-Pelagomonas_calceolata.AAC.1